MNFQTEENSMMPPPHERLTPRQVARTLRELVAMGRVERFRDQSGTVRYRLVARTEVARKRKEAAGTTP